MHMLVNFPVKFVQLKKNFLKMIFSISDLLGYNFHTANKPVDDKSVSIFVRQNTVMIEMKILKPIKVSDMFRLHDFFGFCQNSKMKKFTFRFQTYDDLVWKSCLKASSETLAACGFYCVQIGFFRKEYITFCCGALLDSDDLWSCHRSNCEWVSFVFSSKKKDNSLHSISRAAIDLACKEVFKNNIIKEVDDYKNKETIKSRKNFFRLLEREEGKEINHFILEGVSGVGKTTLINNWTVDYVGKDSDFRKVAFDYPLCGTGNNHEALSAVLYSHISAAKSILKPAGGITDRGGMIPLNGLIYSFGLRDSFMKRKMEVILFEELSQVLFVVAKYLSSEVLMTGLYYGRTLEATLIVLDSEINIAVQRIKKREDEKEKLVKFEVGLGISLVQYISFQNVMWAMLAFFLKDFKTMNIQAIDVCGQFLENSLAKETFLLPISNLSSMSLFLKKVTNCTGIVCIKRETWRHILNR